MSWLDSTPLVLVTVAVFSLNAALSYPGMASLGLPWWAWGLAAAVQLGRVLERWWSE